MKCTRFNESRVKPWGCVSVESRIAEKNSNICKYRLGSASIYYRSHTVEKSVLVVDYIM